MICPILSQSTRDKHGNVVWDHHECIEGHCTFWSEGMRDCGIRASGLVTIANARTALSATPEEAADDMPTEPLLEAIRNGAEAGPDPVIEAIAKSSDTMRSTGLKLLEGVSALEEPIKASNRDTAERIHSLEEGIMTISTSLEGRFAKIEELLGSMPATFQEGLERIENGISAVTPALGSRIDSLQEQMERLPSTLDERMTRLEDSLDDTRRELIESVRAEPEYVKTLERSQEALAGRFGDMNDSFRSLMDGIESVSTRLAELREVNDRISTALSEDADRREGEEQHRLKEQARDLNTRGVALFHRGAIEAAEAAFRAAVEKDSEFAEAHNNLGLALCKGGNEEEAQKVFERALELDPDMAEAMNNLGFLFHKGLQFEKAVELFRKSAFSAEDSSLAYTNLGNACYKLGRYSEAVDAWKKAVEKNPINESAIKALKMFQQDSPH